MPTIDLYNTDISDIEKNEYLFKIKVLREYMSKSENLLPVEIDFLKANFSLLIAIVPYWNQKINSFKLPFERLVINEDVSPNNSRLQSLVNLRYPPLSIADKIDYNRASLKGTCIFYAGSMGMLPITVEVQPKAGQMITSSKWKFNAKRELKFVNICFSHQSAIKNHKELWDDYKTFQECLKQMQPNNKEVVIEVTKFIEDAFTKTVSPNKRQGYIMSALIADYFFNNPDDPVDAIYYPSVPNRGSAMNIAIKPGVVDELFDMIEASESIVFSDPASGKGGWFSFGTAKCTSYDKDSLKLEWQQSQIPKDHAINEIIKSYDIKFD
ncbi:hypothetical protein [Fluviicola taffensis]|uniref:RES domain-containing protein n=1 Tax=Fluviicola taffensis (strain DSM 16823 / NCIMB 13979 / RW262) TaxID=755732 RepID=F2I9R2_FLUTR|nr:hypothetical protein [Fluviicola taffensis]AEA43058.1 hypothetical protein Fluta_1060 [Fluviicola taffensis DSM 16823]